MQQQQLLGKIETTPSVFTVGDTVVTKITLAERKEGKVIALNSGLVVVAWEDGGLCVRQHEDMSRIVNKVWPKGDTK